MSISVVGLRARRSRRGRRLDDLIRAHHGGRRRGIGGRPSPRAWLRTGLRSAVVGVRGSGPLPWASVLLATMALGMVGVSLMVSEGVSAATSRWRGGVETIVFVRHDATADQIASVRAVLESDPATGTLTYVDRDASAAEFATMFADDEALVASVSPEALPTSFKVVPATDADPAAVDRLSQRARTTPFVYAVADAADAVHPILRATALARRVLMALAVVLGAVWCVLAFASARAAVWARREEVAVMNLVGAPRALIRMPFTGEGAVIGLLGGLASGVCTWLLTERLERWAAGQSRWPLVRGFEIPPSYQLSVAIGLAVVGMAVGAASARLACRVRALP